MFFGFALLKHIHPLLFSLLVLIGTLVGLEIPLLMRLMPGKQQLKEVVARAKLNGAARSGSYSDAMDKELVGA